MVLAGLRHRDRGRQPVTKPKPDARTGGPGLRLTPIPHEEHVPLFHSPVFWGIVVAIVFVILQYHLLVGGNNEIRRNAVDLVLHRRFSGGQRVLIFAARDL